MVIPSIYILGTIFKVISSSSSNCLLSITSNHEKNLFFSMLKSLYQIPNLNMKCYKLNEKIGHTKLGKSLHTNSSKELDVR